MKTQTRNWLIALAVLACPFVLFLGFLIFKDLEPLPPLASLPNPNGYDDLVKAGKMLSPGTSDYNGKNAEQLQEIISADATALALGRAGLSNECRVPIQYSISYISNHLTDLAGLKRLAQGFVADGLLAEMENRPRDAARSFLDTIHLGNEMMRGGVLIDGLVGIAIKTMGTVYLQKLVPRLDADTCHETAETLETLDAQSQTWNEVMHQENNWSHGTYPGWRYDLARWEDRKSLATMRESAKKKFDRQERQTRQLMIDLAARAYELDDGKPPSSVADLVPDYLKAVPQDPVTGTSMVYLPR